MITTFLGCAVRFTDALYERHLMLDGTTLWMGNGGLMRNIVSMSVRGDIEIQRRLIEHMSRSAKLRRSVEWNT